MPRPHLRAPAAWSMAALAAVACALPSTAAASDAQIRKEIRTAAPRLVKDDGLLSRALKAKATPAAYRQLAKVTHRYNSDLKAFRAFIAHTPASSTRGQKGRSALIKALTQFGHGLTGLNKGIQERKAGRVTAAKRDLAAAKRALKSARANLRKAGPLLGIAI